MIMNEDLATYKETLMGHLKHDTPVNKPHLVSLTQHKFIISINIALTYRDSCFPKGGLNTGRNKYHTCEGNFN